MAVGGSAWLTVSDIAAVARNKVYLDTGTLNAIAITIPGVASYSDILDVPIWVNPAFTNTTNACTISVNGLTVQNFNTVGTGGYGNVGIGTLAANKISEIVWDGTVFQYLGRVVTASAAQIIAGLDTISPITSAGFLAANPHLTPFTNSAGYQQYSSGFIIQWGTFTPPSGNGDTFALPLTFPNRGVAMLANPANFGATGYYATSGFTNNSTGVISVFDTSGSVVGGKLCHWGALGF